MSNRSLSPDGIVFFNGLRFFLASTVVVGHGFGFFFNYWDGFFPHKFPYIQSIAVVGFFFVSGFLISISVLEKIKSDSISFRSYMADRFSRIYCTLIPCLLFVAIVDYVAYKIYPNYEFADSLNLPTFVQNVFLIPSIPFGSMRPIWSLMFEWWIYVFFGGLIFVRKNIVFGIFAIVLGAYYTFFVNGRGEAGQLGVIWILGALSAFYFKNVSQTRFNKKVMSALLLISAAALYVFALDAYDLYVGSLFCGGLLFLAAHINEGNIRLAGNSITYQFLAGYSFTLFLTHYTVLSWIWRAGIHGISGFLLSIVTANIIAIVVAKYTEKHHKNLSRWVNEMLSMNCEPTKGRVVASRDSNEKR